MATPSPLAAIARFIDKLRRYAGNVKESREQLRESNGERPLPPIPPDDRRPKP